MQICGKQQHKHVPLRGIAPPHTDGRLQACNDQYGRDNTVYAISSNQTRSNNWGICVAIVGALLSVNPVPYEENNTANRHIYRNPSSQVKRNAHRHWQWDKFADFGWQEISHCIQWLSKHT